MVAQHFRVPVSVLLVADDERVRHGLRRPMERCGAISVVGSASLEDDAATLAQGLAPDIILLDFHAQDPAALSLVARLAERAPVLILSSYLTQEEWACARSAGAVDFHLKRIGVADLARKIESVCATRRANAADEP